jgi:hypothetical protein
MALTRATKKPIETTEVGLSDIAWIKTTLSQVNSKLQDVEVTLIKLNQTVIGDKTYGQIGLIEKVEEHNTYIEKDKEFKSRLVGGGIVLSVIWGMILKFWKIN